VRPLLPRSYSRKIAFLAVGDDLGQLELVGVVSSARCGKILIEDTMDSESESASGDSASIGWPRLRRMVFEGQRSSVQSLVRVMKDPALQGNAPNVGVSAGSSGSKRRGKRSKRGGGGGGGGGGGAPTSTPGADSGAGTIAGVSGWPSAVASPTRLPS